MMNLQQLNDLEEIRQLKYRYCRCIDMANFEELESLFTPEAAVCYVGGSYRFEAQGRDKILEALRYAFHAEAISTHHVNHPEITLTSDTTATGTWYLRDWFLNLKLMITTDGASLYKDRYVKRDGRWLIEFSSYSRIYEIVGDVTQRPNITAHYLGQHAAKLPG